VSRPLDAPYGPWKVGDRVRVHQSGRTGTVVRAAATFREQMHRYVRVAWDEPVFGVEASNVSPTILEPYDA
jgi:hypothetical protein